MSNKFDIFSLGAVIIKIMTGSKGYIKSAEMSPPQFIELVSKSSLLLASYHLQVVVNNMIFLTIIVRFS